MRMRVVVLSWHFPAKACPGLDPVDQGSHKDGVKNNKPKGFNGKPGGRNASGTTCTGGLANAPCDLL
jgi:hypothetical protein